MIGNERERVRGRDRESKIEIETYLEFWESFKVRVGGINR